MWTFSFTEGKEENRLDNYSERFKKLESEVIDLKKLIFKYLDVSKNEVKSEFVHKDGYLDSVTTTELVKKSEELKKLEERDDSNDDE